MLICASSTTEVHPFTFHCIFLVSFAITLLFTPACTCIDVFAVVDWINHLMDELMLLFCVCHIIWCVVVVNMLFVRVPTCLPSRGGDVMVYAFDIKWLLFCSCACLCLYGPFNCISFHEFSQQLSAFSLCSSSLISVLLVLSTKSLIVKVSFSPDIIRSGWLGWKHQLTN